MSTAAKIGKKAVWLADSIVNLFVLVVILLLLLLGCYALWDSGQVADDASPERYASYKPDAGKSGPTFQELQRINPDVFAWLTVYGTNIDYPVVQGKDNNTYINTGADGKHLLSGAIFLDYRNSKDFSDFNSIIYGHHMEKRVMFGDLGLFNDKQFFDSHRYAMLYYGGREHGIEFFAFFPCDGYNDTVFHPKVTGTENQQAYLDMILDMAIYTRSDVSVTTEDRIVLLATCSSILTNGRSILVGKITDKAVDDPFKSEETNNTNTISVIDRFAGIWAEAPLLAKVIVAALPLLLILLLVVLMYRRKQRKQRRLRDEAQNAQREEDG